MMRILATIFGVPTLVFCTLLGTAQARSVPFIRGHASDPNRLTCFLMDTFKGTTMFFSGPASLDNSQCGSGAIYELPLSVDNGGGKNVTFTVQGVFGTQCRALGMARNLTMQSVSVFVAPPVQGPFVNVAVPTVNVPTGGYLYLDCDITAGANFTVANYNP